MDTCVAAVKFGHLDCLQYAVENGCPWNKEKCLEYAIYFNKNLIINYIKNLEKKMKMKFLIMKYFL
jgi:hypothetical protein